MSVKDLTQADFEYYRSYANDMLKVHEREFIKYMDPQLMRAMYRGRTKYEAAERENYGTVSDPNEHIMALIMLFQGTNTILPNLYYQNPSPIVKPGKGSEADSAALMSAILKHNMKLNEAKRQNQEGVLNSWFFGLGWKKMGVRSVYAPKVDEPESQLEPNVLMRAVNGIQSMMGMGPQSKPDFMESKESPELCDYEMFFNDSENPMNVAVDHKTDLWNRKAILHSLPRTCHDLEMQGDYDDEQLEALLEKMRSKYGSRFDSRRDELHLREMFIQQRNGLWILSYVDEFDQPLRYVKADMKIKGDPFEPLSLTFEPGVRYPVSHMKVASQVQKKADDLASLFVELTARGVNLTCVNEDALANGQKATLERNLARGLLKFKGPINDQTIRSFTSNGVSNDLPNLLSLLSNKVNEIIGADNQLVSGKSQNDTLGQDELARSGTKVREAGMRDRIRDWMIAQVKKEAALIKQYHNSELDLLITGKDYADPMTGEKIEDKWVSFMSESNPLGARHYLQGEFDYDFNMDEATRPDKRTQREALVSLLELASNPNVQQASLQSQMRFRLDKIAVGIAGTLDNVINPDEYIERLDPMQAAAAQAQAVMMSNGGMVGPKTVPVPKDKGKQPGNDNGITQSSSVEANT